jgi:predicted DnaQ family exonuclease/DinG family helicase
MRRTLVLARKFVIFDLETTGMQPGFDEIIEIGAVKLVDGEIVERFQTLVHPRQKLPLSIQRLTGISEEELKNQPSIEEVLPGFIEFVGNTPMVGHNVGFDLGFMTAALGHRLSQTYYDTVELARWCFPLAPNYRLAGLAQFLGIVGENFHRALNDAEVTARLFQRCLDKLLGFDLDLLHQVNQLLAGSSNPTVGLLQEVERELSRKFPNRLIRESSLCLASPEVGGLFAPTEEKQRPKFVQAEVMEVLGAKGSFAAHIPNYQFRPGQLEMQRGVVQAFSTDSHLVVEAGTGTGKSLAYLVPAIFWAASQGEKVVISTHTITLQEQLWDKDIPLLRHLLNLDFLAALVKGRNNYLCLRKWQALHHEPEQLSSEDRREMAGVLTWLSETASGDRAELNLSPKGAELWNRLGADSDSCLGNRCRFFNNGCFVMRARRKAEEADILIVNHSLLLSDVKTENKVLPAYSYLVIDEAHHLEDSATEHLGKVLGEGQIDQLYRLLQRSGATPGLLSQIKFRLPSFTGKLGDDNIEHLEQLLGQAAELLGQVQEAARDFFSCLITLAQNYGEGENSSIQLRLREQYTELSIWPPLCSAQERLTLRLTNLAETLKKMTQNLEDAENEELAGLVRDINSHGAFCVELGATAGELLDRSIKNQVVWVEKDERSCRLRSAPIEVGPMLKELLFDKLKAGVLTSATLAVDNSFEHFLLRVGLHPMTDYLQVESPFKFEEQALLCIPRDLPNPSEVGDGAYINAVVPWLIDLVRIVQGRTLLLFTSHKMLKEVYFQVKPYLEAEDIQVLGHNLDGGRSRLVEEFKANPRTVLLGASSFWEGVDIQGDTLSCVVIVKLPFWPPTMPTLEARIEELQRQDKDGFRHLSMPQAVIRLKQGFGRLIRTQEDRGVVVILDNRLVTKRYGRKFLNSLPLKTHLRGDSELVLRKIKSWLEQKQLNPPLKLVQSAEDALNEAKKLKQC